MPLLRLPGGNVSVLEVSFRAEAEKYSQSDYYYAKNQTIVHEGHQAVPPEVAQEDRDDHCAGHGADRHAHRKRYPHVGCNASVLVDIPGLLSRRGRDGR